MHFVITEKEYDILTKKASCEELMLYMILKRFADFKTGLFSHKSAKRVNLSFLAGLMTRGSRQGKAEEKYAHSEVRRFLDRLVELGLVGDIAREGFRTLTMRLKLVGNASAVISDTPDRLPGRALSEAGRSDTSCGSAPEGGNAVNTAGSKVVDAPKSRRLSGNAAKTEGKLSRNENAKSSATSTVQGVQGASASAFSTGKQQSILSSGLTSESRISPSAPEKTTPHAASRLAGNPERRKSAETSKPALSAEIVEYVEFLQKESGKALLYPYSDKSVSIYQGWKLSKFDLRDIGEAFRKVASSKWMKLTPDSVDTMLRELSKPVAKIPSRGSLCL
ncbi:MAG: hypothetical protein WCK63_16410 [Betaproteobacteria bacterium]